MYKLSGYLIFVCLLICSSIDAQPKLENKYKIELPNRWQGNSKLLFKITNMLTKYVSELKERQECLRCNGKYTVKFGISNPKVTAINYRNATNDFCTYYWFMGTIDVYNEENNMIKRIIMVDSSVNNIFYYQGPNQTGSYDNTSQKFNEMRKEIAYKAQLIQQNNWQDLNRYEATTAQQKANNLERSFDAPKFIEENRKKLTPSEDYLWDAFEKQLIGFKLPVES